MITTTRVFRAAFTHWARLANSHERVELKGDELRPLLACQAALLNPLATSWELGQPVRMEASWDESVAATRAARQRLCTSWDPTRPIVDAIRRAYLIDRINRCATEPLQQVLHPFTVTSPDDSCTDSATLTLVEALQIWGDNVFEPNWIAACLTGTGSETSALPAAIYASWVLEQRPDLVEAIHRFAQPIMIDERYFD